MVCPVAIWRGIQQLAYSVAMPDPRESAENKYLGHRMLFTLENQRSHTRKVKIIWKKKQTMKRMPCLREVGPYTICLAP
jgi:hypothetical protein